MKGLKTKVYMVLQEVNKCKEKELSNLQRKKMSEVTKIQKNKKRIKTQIEILANLKQKGQMMIGIETQ